MLNHKLTKVLFLFSTKKNGTLTRNESARKILMLHHSVKLNDNSPESCASEHKNKLFCYALEADSIVIRKLFAAVIDDECLSKTKTALTESLSSYI
jgi:hypothetical protein